jgi:hypothetical protein
MIKFLSENKENALPRLMENTKNSALPETQFFSLESIMPPDPLG